LVACGPQSWHPEGLVKDARASPTVCAIGCLAKITAGSLGLSLSWPRTRSASHARISGVMLSDASSTIGLAAPSEVLSRCGPAIARINSASTTARMIRAGILRSSPARAIHHKIRTPAPTSK
jgi:hypothetical protein